MLHYVELAQPGLVKRIARRVYHMAQSVLFRQHEHRVQEALHRFGGLDKGRQPVSFVEEDDLGVDEQSPVLVLDNSTYRDFLGSDLFFWRFFLRRFGGFLLSLFLVAKKSLSFRIVGGWRMSGGWVRFRAIFVDRFELAVFQERALKPY